MKANDADSPGPQNEVHYRLLDVPDPAGPQLFRIDEVTGEIFPNAKFDRERRDMYILTVEARDNLPSALPGVKGPNKGKNRSTHLIKKCFRQRESADCNW